jgi:hypothetical protein
MEIKQALEARKKRILESLDGIFEVPTGRSSLRRAGDLIVELILIDEMLAEAS